MVALINTNTSTNTNTNTNSNTNANANASTNTNIHRNTKPKLCKKCKKITGYHLRDLFATNKLDNLIVAYLNTNTSANTNT